jgi:hypothetical protein
MDEMAQKIKLSADAQVIPGPERIIRALAAMKPDAFHCYEVCGCVFCGDFANDIDEHAAACLYRLAYVWVAANPA